MTPTWSKAAGAIQWVAHIAMLRVVGAAFQARLLRLGIGSAGHATDRVKSPKKDPNISGVGLPRGSRNNSSVATSTAEVYESGLI